MFNYIPEFFKAETADNIEEADRWYDDKSNNRRPPELLPRDEVARAINSEIKAGRGSPHGGVFLDIASRRTPEYIQKRLPSMYHQFKELAEVDITKEPMEIGPTCHYVMGGVEVDPDSAVSKVPGLYAAGEVAGGMHGANRLGGNSLGDLLVFGKRAGELRRRVRRAGCPADRPRCTRRTWMPPSAEALAPFNIEGGENPYTVHQELQEVMQDLVGIIRTESELSGRDPEDRRALRGPHRQAQRRGAPPVQPGLAPAHRPAQHAPGLRGGRRGRPRAQGEPRRPHPGRLPDDGLRLLGQAQPDRRADDDGHADGPPAAAAGAPARAGRTPGGAALDDLRPQAADLARRLVRRGTSSTSPSPSTRARWSSTPSTTCRRCMPGTWPCAGTARRASAGRARPRSTASPG